MRAILLAASVVLTSALPAAPAIAADRTAASNGFGVTVHRRGGGDGDHRRHRRDRPIVVETGSVDYGGEWALHNNRSFASDSYNDWWHDNPERAFPRWVTSGQCARQWYGADTLRC